MQGKSHVVEAGRDPFIGLLLHTWTSACVLGEWSSCGLSVYMYRERLQVGGDDFAFDWCGGKPVVWPRFRGEILTTSL